MEKPLRYFVKYFFLFYLLVGNGISLLGQGGDSAIKKNFTYKDKKNKNRRGNFQFYLQYNDVGQGRIIPDISTGIMRFSDEVSPEFEFSLFRVDLSRSRDEANGIFLVNPTEIRTSKNVKLLDNHPIECLTKDSNCRDKRIRFKATKNGGAFLEIYYSLLLQDGDIRKVALENDYITIAFTIEGVKIKETPKTAPPMPPPGPVDEETFDWQRLQNQGLKGYFGYLAKYNMSQGKYFSEADYLIKREEENLWNAAVQENSKETYENYIKAFARYPNYLKHKESAERRIAKILENREDYTAWRKARKTNTVEAYREYLANYIISADKAERAIIKLSPISVISTNVSANQKRIKISNTKNPRFKDVSLDEGLHFDLSHFASDTILLVSFEPGKRYKILIEDDWGKKDSVSFDNSMEASMVLNPLDSSLYVFKIKKGAGPYSIEFVHAESGLPAWTKTDIRTSDTVQVSFADFQARGLSGQFTAAVWDQSSWKPVSIATPIFIPAINDGQDWLVPVLIICGVLLLLSALLGFIWRKRKEKNQHYSLG